ncbi:MAG: hypothetical protein JW910_18080 [Anaerolineae bacterium]|nr:hypothetical protein [Anaerolineae bacterium]
MSNRWRNQSSNAQAVIVIFLTFAGVLVAQAIGESLGLNLGVVAAVVGMAVLLLLGLGCFLRWFTDYEEADLSVLEQEDRVSADDLPLVIDLGMLIYPVAARSIKESQVYRQGTFPQGAYRVRAFAIMQATNYRPKAIRFILRDADGTPCLDDAFQRRLKPEETFVPGERWLSVPEDADFERWTLELYVNDALLTVHDFRLDHGGGALRAHLSGDGELSDELVTALAKEYPLTLDELLQE